MFFSLGKQPGPYEYGMNKRKLHRDDEPLPAPSQLNFSTYENDRENVISINTNDKGNNLQELTRNLNVLNSKENTSIVELVKTNECGTFQRRLHFDEEPLPKLRRSDEIPYESYAENFITVNQPDPPNDAFINSNSIVSDYNEKDTHVENIEISLVNENKIIRKESITPKKCSKPLDSNVTSPSLSKNIEQIINRLDEADNISATSPSLQKIRPIIHPDVNSNFESDDEIPLIKLIPASSQSVNSKTPPPKGKHVRTETKSKAVLQSVPVSSIDADENEKAINPDSSETNENPDAEIKLASSVGATIYIETCCQWIKKTGNTQLVFQYMSANNSLTKALCDALKWEYDTSLQETKRNKSTASILRRYARKNMKNNAFRNAIFGTDNEDPEPEKESNIPIQKNKKKLPKHKAEENKTGDHVCKNKNCEVEKRRLTLHIRELKRENKILKCIKMKLNKKFKICMIPKTSRKN